MLLYVCVLNRIRKMSVDGVFNLADSSDVSRRFGMNMCVAKVNHAVVGAVCRIGDEIAAS